MKKGKLFGWEKVFAFTLKQQLKSTGNIVMMVIFFLFTLLAYPIMTAVMNSDTAVKEETSIKTLIISDKTDLELESWLDINKLSHEGFVLPGTVEFTDKDIIMDQKTEKTDSNIDLNDEKYQDTAAVTISFDEKSFIFSIIGTYPSKGNVSKSDLTDITEMLKGQFTLALAEHKGITPDQVKYLNASVNSDTVVYQPEQDAESDEATNEPKLSSGEYGITIIVLCIVIMLVSLSGEQVASAVLQEKASKLVEFLLTSLQPLALMVGKVLAVFVMTLIDVALMVVGLYASTFITDALYPANTVNLADTFEKLMSVSGEAVGLNIQYFMIPVAILIILVGALFYSVLAALAGACVSKIEELTEGMKLFTVTLMVGAYFGMIVSIIDMASEAPMSVRMIAEYLPLSSVSFAPSYLVLGKMTALEGLISLGILVVATVLMFMLAAKVYEAMIYHKGSNLKLKDIVSMAKKNGGEK